MQNVITNCRIEVMQTIGQSMDSFLSEYLKPIEENWQPTDFLPDPNSLQFSEQVREMQGLAREMSYDLMVVLVGDVVTEEALPTYESWLMSVDGINNIERNGWSQWVRSWTAEENQFSRVGN